jgi:signal transduction histidine kinase
VDLHQGIDNTLLILRHRLQHQLSPETSQNESAEIQVMKNYGAVPKVECFASLLNQVFMNILSNAIDALESQSINSNGQVIPSDHSQLVEGAIATVAPTSNGLGSPINHHTCPVDSASNQEIPQKNTLLKIPQIQITTEIISGDRVAIRIKDNGYGMTEPVRQRIFDPFFTTKPVGSGTGLGLSISYQIVVEKHHGDLSCVSEPGQGTEFIIELPIHQ